jgi:protein-S-isoprenylcysteine O-methyltransferase Ste14
VTSRPSWYAGICLVIPAMGLASGSASLLLAAAVLYGVMARLVRREEAWLGEQFGEAWSRYRDATPLFLPLGGRALRGR